MNISTSIIYAQHSILTYETYFSILYWVFNDRLQVMTTNLLKTLYLDKELTEDELQDIAFYRGKLHDNILSLCTSLILYGSYYQNLGKIFSTNIYSF